MPPPGCTGSHHRVPVSPQLQGDRVTRLQSGSLGNLCHPTSPSPGHGVPTLWTEVVIANACTALEARR